MKVNIMKMAMELLCGIAFEIIALPIVGIVVFFLQLDIFGDMTPILLSVFVFFPVSFLLGVILIDMIIYKNSIWNKTGIILSAIISFPSSYLVIYLHDSVYLNTYIILLVQPLAITIAYNLPEYLPIGKYDL